MPKYRRLSLEELKQLEDSFIRFLAAQSITGADWKKISEDEADRSVQLIDAFSDVVMEKTLHNVKNLEQRLPGRIVFYKFYDKHAIMIGLELKEGQNYDMSKDFSWIELAEVLEKEKDKFSFLSGRKEYIKSRSEEVFEILQQGCQISENEDNFNSMLSLLGK